MVKRKHPQAEERIARKMTTRIHLINELKAGVVTTDVIKNLMKDYEQEMGVTLSPLNLGE